MKHVIAMSALSLVDSPAARVGARAATIAAAAAPPNIVRLVIRVAAAGVLIQSSMPLAEREYFGYGKTMDASTTDAAVARIAAAIGEPARTRMLYCLLDGHARTSTELAIVGEVTPSTASLHLNKLRAEGLITANAQGRHRYYTLKDAHVARVLETLCVVAGRPRAPFEPSTPSRYRVARSCYDHLAGRIGVQILERLRTQRWIRATRTAAANSFELTPDGAAAMAALEIDVDAARAQRRRFAYGCLDWSERRLHLAGAMGAALLNALLRRRWLERDMNSRALQVTAAGRRELRHRFELEV